MAKKQGIKQGSEGANSAFDRETDNTIRLAHLCGRESVMTLEDVREETERRTSPPVHGTLFSKR